MNVNVQLVIKTENPPHSLEGVTVLKGHSIVEMSPSEYAEKYEHISNLLKETDWFPRLVLWEEGGGYTNTGNATCISNPNGAPVKPVFIRTKGSLACGRHAKFAISDAVICDVDRWRDDLSIELTRIKIDGPRVIEEKIWAVKDINYSEDIVPVKYSKYLPLINAAIKKSRCYHCREPHYAA